MSPSNFVKIMDVVIGVPTPVVVNAIYSTPQCESDFFKVYKCDRVHLCLNKFRSKTEVRLGELAISEKKVTTLKSISNLANTNAGNIGFQKRKKC